MSFSTFFGVFFTVCFLAANILLLIVSEYNLKQIPSVSSGQFSTKTIILSLKIGSICDTINCIEKKIIVKPSHSSLRSESKQTIPTRIFENRITYFLIKSF